MKDTSKYGLHHFSLKVGDVIEFEGKEGLHTVHSATHRKGGGGGMGEGPKTSTITLESGHKIYVDAWSMSRMRPMRIVRSETLSDPSDPLYDQYTDVEIARIEKEAARKKQAAIEADRLNELRKSATEKLTAEEFAAITTDK